VWSLVYAVAASRAPIAQGFAYRMGELRYAVRAEFAMSVGDLLIRRLPLAFELPDQARSVAGRVADFVSLELGWSPSARDAAVERFDAEISRMFAGRRST
jgi:glycerol-3-phosphate dehydrogenase